jgi:RNA polymerase sigma factor (sigma-70 family)
MSLQSARSAADLASGTPLMERLNVVSPMTSPEETALCERLEDIRFAMLESILSVPLGRRLFHEPFGRLLDGETMTVSIVDPSQWGMRNQRLPESRVVEMRALLKGTDRTYLDREAVRKLHLSWVRVEEVGRLTFAGLEICRNLIRRRKEILDELELDFVEVQDLAISRSAPPLPEDGPSLRAWVFYPELASIRMELDLIEIGAGMDIHRYMASALRYREASEKLADIIERFVESNLRLVISRVRGYYTGNAMDEMDLVQEGCQGLMQAVSRFDYSRGFRFSTYAVWWIKQAVLKAIMKHSRLVRIPLSVLSENAMIREAMDSMTAEHGHPPTTDELAEHLEMNVRDVEEILSATDPSLSLDHTTGEQDSTIADFLAGSVEPPESEATLSENRELVRAAMGTLSDRDKTIVTLRFGLLDGRPCSLAEIGDMYGLSRERVRQIELRAMEKLRRYCLSESTDGADLG